MGECRFGRSHKHMWCPGKYDDQNVFNVKQSYQDNTDQVDSDFHKEPRKIVEGKDYASDIGRVDSNVYKESCKIARGKDGKDYASNTDEGDSNTDEGDSNTDEGDSNTDEGDSDTDEGDSDTDEVHSDVYKEKCKIARGKNGEDYASDTDEVDSDVYKEKCKIARGKDCTSDTDREDSDVYKELGDSLGEANSQKVREDSPLSDKEGIPSSTQLQSLQSNEDTPGEKSYNSDTHCVSHPEGENTLLLDQQTAYHRKRRRNEDLELNIKDRELKFRRLE